MTRDANLKRAARARARLTGQSYAKVRAEMERDDLSLAREILGETPISIEQVLISGRGWAEPYVHRVHTKRQVVYLKHGPAAKTGGSYALEAWAYRTCRARGVLVPAVIDAAEHGADLDYIATVELPGASLWQQHLSRDVLRAVLHEAGENLRVLHEIELEGYGRVVRPGAGGAATWCPMIEAAQTKNLPYLVERGVLTAEEADRIQQQLADAKTCIAPDGPSRLLHGDLEGDHIFSDGQRFTGLIDFGSMQAGDPVYDLARFAWWDAGMLADLLDGYGRDRLTDEDLQVRMPAYLIANSTRVADALRRGDMVPQQAGEFVRIACGVRFDRSPSGITAAAPAPKTPFEILVDAVRGKTDEQIDAFAASLGGYGTLCRMVFDGLNARNSPEEDCTVGFVLREDLGWVLRSVAGKIKVTKRIPKRAPAIVRTTPQDFLRWVIGELPHTTAIAEDRMTVEGDRSEPRKMFALWAE